MPTPMLTGAMLGLSVAAPFGPVSLLCVQQSLTRGCRHGVMAGLGAATAHGIFATAATAGARVVSTALAPWAGPIHLASALILAGLGVRTIARARSAATPGRTVSLRATFASLLLLALSNPMTIIPYLALATVVAGNDTGDAALSLGSVPGVVLAAAAWYAGLSFVASTLRRGMAAGTTRILNLAAGATLIVFGAVVGRTFVGELAAAIP